jgi:plastocyanin
VNLAFDNKGEAFHTLTIDDLDFQIEAEGGGREEGALTIEQPGTYRITCSVAGHAEAGMTGTLVAQ